ncbi:hypothetical protein GF314_01015 [bacterium]|nr:hypothetical protein [bacterium]
MNRSPRNQTIAAALVAVIAVAASAPAQDADPYERLNDTWITVDGIVQSVSRDAFVLDFGAGVITVEMDDGDRDADAYVLERGNKVSVHGVIDDGFMEDRTIEASRVFVEKLGTTFYASARDEEDTWTSVDQPVVMARTVLVGKVTEVRDESFILENRDRSIEVTVERLPHDPLDYVGYQRIGVGDRVTVSGRIDEQLFDDQTFVARSIAKLDE